MLKIINSNLRSRLTLAPALNPQLTRPIFKSAVLGLKRIEKVEDKSKKLITIEGKYLNAEEEFGSKVLRLGDAKEVNTEDPTQVLPCSFCELDKKGIHVQYTDVLVLRQFLTEHGQVLPRKVTGLCKRQQRKLLVLTKLAKQAGLILNLQPTLLDGGKPSVDPSKREKHMKWNSYYDTYETMIRKQKFL